MMRVAAAARELCGVRVAAHGPREPILKLYLQFLLF